MGANEPKIEEWLSLLREEITHREPDLTCIFEVYANEARFGRAYIDNKVDELPKGSSILEIGAGSMILSCQLVREGFCVTAVEPTGTGFSHFERLRSLVLKCASSWRCEPKYLWRAAEELELESEFDFAFSINVMEHVNDVSAVLDRVGASLRPGATYKFTCPNYHFPYEPHFNMPTLLSKSLTSRAFRRRIFDRTDILDPAGVWDSLNWITVSQIKLSLINHGGFQLDFNKGFLISAIERIKSDEEFAKRRSLWMSTFLLLVAKLRLHKLARVLPPEVHPVIDCSMTRVSAMGEIYGPDH